MPSGSLSTIVATQEGPEAIRATDLAFHTIGYRLATANAALCDRLQPGTGLVIHTLLQYTKDSRGPAQRLFGFRTGASIEAVVAGSPAQIAGLRADDSLVRIAGLDLRALPDADAKPSTDRLVEIFRAIAARPPEAPIEVEVLRGGEAVTATIRPRPACLTRFELDLDSGFEGEADGEVVKLGVGILEKFGESAVVTILAHELSHNILRHRARLDEVGVARGLASGFGRNMGYFRQTEIEADILSVYLLTNAGYPPDYAAQAWRKFGPATGGFLRAATHPGWRDRVATIEAEAKRVAAHTERPIVPALLGARDERLNGDWRKLLVRAR